MAMPEAAVDKDGSVIPRQYDIGLTGQVFDVEPEPETCAVEQ
jgi:hypothetical protein